MQPDPAPTPAATGGISTKTLSPGDPVAAFLPPFGPPVAGPDPPPAAVSSPDIDVVARCQALEEELRWALQMRDQAIRNVSHEFRTPLTLVQGYLELLDDGELGPLNEAQRRGVGVARRAAQRLQQVVDRLLMLQELGNGELNRVPVESSNWLKQAVERWRANNLPEQMDLRIGIPPALPAIMIDANYLNHVVDSLLANAAKFGSPGGVIEVHASAEDNALHLTVSDQGIGIGPEQLDMVFEQFYQVDSSVRRPQGGMGVGLALCRRAVEAHGGRIWAESAGEGRGSTFHVSLPALST